MNLLTLKQWAEDDQPREKLLRKGRLSLSDAELVAILFGSGSREKTAVELAKEVLYACKNDLSQLSRYHCDDLKQFKGIGEAKAITLMAALELGRRRAAQVEREIVKIKSSKDAYTILKPYFSDLSHEEFYVIYLNNSNVVLSCEQLSKGGSTGTVVDGKILFKRAIQLMANGVILSHNHPSGNLKPSEPDKRLTKDLSTFGKMIDISILDHLIITDYGYLSFADELLL